MKNILFYLLIIINVISIILIYNTKENIDYINVEIKGAIKKPGVYQMDSNKTVNDLIKLAGDLLENADVSVTNRAKTLVDEMVVIIYTNEEIDSARKNSSFIKYIDKECVCPKIINNTCIENKITNNEEIIVKETNKISLNTASKEELMELKGIGESKALKIIEYRDINKGFKTIDELLNVKGIGSAIYEKIKDNITL